MRALTEPEMKALLEKLAQYIGNSLKDLIAPLDDSPNSDRYVFRLHGNRIYYVLLSIANLATSISRDALQSLGTCLAKVTKSGKVKLLVTSLDILAPRARYKIYVKKNGEMPFLYGGHILKAHVGRWPEDTPEHQGIVVYSMDDIPLGFGLTARSTAQARQMDPTGIVCFRQSDCGEYLRDEDTLFVSGK